MCVHIVSVCLLSLTYVTDEDSCIAVKTLFWLIKILKTSISEMMHEIYQSFRTIFKVNNIVGLALAKMHVDHS